MKNKIDLGKYNLNHLLRNPGLIHKIQDNLMALEGTDLLSVTYRTGAKTNIDACIKLIVDNYPKNPEIVIKAVGKETLKLIEKFEGITLADDLKDINI